MQINLNNLEHYGNEYLLFNNIVRDVQCCVKWLTESEIMIFLIDREPLSKATRGPSEVCGSLQGIDGRRDESENLQSSSSNADRHKEFAVRSRNHYHGSAISSDYIASGKEYHEQHGKRARGRN